MPHIPLLKSNQELKQAITHILKQPPYLRSQRITQYCDNLTDNVVARRNLKIRLQAQISLLL